MTSTTYNQQNAQHWYLKGNTNFHHHRYSTAHSCYLKSIHLNPRHAKAHFKIALLHEKSLVQHKHNHGETILKHYTESAELGYRTAQYNLGILLMKRRDNIEALRWLFEASKQGHERSRMLLEALIPRNDVDQKWKAWGEGVTHLVENVRHFLYSDDTPQKNFSPLSTTTMSPAANRSPRYFTLDNAEEDEQEMFMSLGDEGEHDDLTDPDSASKYNADLQVYSMRRIIVERQLESLSETSSVVSNADDMLTSRSARFSIPDVQFLEDSMVSEKLEDDALTDSFAYSDEESQPQSRFLSPPPSAQKAREEAVDSQDDSAKKPPAYPTGREDAQHLEDVDAPAHLTPVNKGSALLSTPKGAISPYRRTGPQGSSSALRQANNVTNTPSQLTAHMSHGESQVPSTPVSQHLENVISVPTPLTSSPRTLSKQDLGQSPSPTTSPRSSSPAKTPINSTKKFPTLSRKSTTPLRQAHSPPKSPHISQSKPRIPPQRSTPITPKRKSFSSPASANKRQPSPIQRASPKATASPPKVPSLRLPKHKQNASNIGISTTLEDDPFAYEVLPEEKLATRRTSMSSSVYSPPHSASRELSPRSPSPMKANAGTSPMTSPREAALLSSLLSPRLPLQNDMLTPRSARSDQGVQKSERRQAYTTQSQTMETYHPPPILSEMSLQTDPLATSHFEIQHRAEAYNMSAQTVFYTDEFATQTPLPPQQVENESQTVQVKKRHFMVQMRGEAFQRHFDQQTDDKKIVHQTAQTVPKIAEDCEIQTDPIPEKVKIVIQRPDIDAETVGTQSEGTFVPQAQHTALVNELNLTKELVQELKDSEDTLRDKASKQLAKKDQQLNLQQARIDMLLNERQKLMEGEEVSKTDIDNLTKQIKQCRATIKQQQDIIANMTTTHAEEVETLKKQNAQLRTTFERSSNREKELFQEERDALNQKLSTAISKLHDAQRLLQEREDELFKLKHDYQLSDRKLARQERTAKQFEEEIAKLKQQIQGHYVTIRQLDDNILSRDEQIQKLKDAQIQAREKMEDLNSVIRELRGRLSSNEIDSKAHTALKLSQDQMRNDYDKKIEQLKSIIAQLHAKIQTQTTDHADELQVQKQAFEKQLKTLQQEHARDREQWEIEANSHLRSKGDALVRQLQDEQTKTRNQQELIRTLKSTINTQKEEAKIQQQKIEHLESSLETMQDKLKEVIEQRQESRSQVEEWKVTTNNRLQMLKEEYQRNTAHYKQQLALKEEELVKMRKKFSRVLTKMDTVIDQNTGGGSRTRK